MMVLLPSASVLGNFKSLRRLRRNRKTNPMNQPIGSSPSRAYLFEHFLDGRYDSFNGGRRIDSIVSTAPTESA